MGPRSRARSLEHTDRLFRAAYALCGSQADAQDLVWATFARAFQRPRSARRASDPAYLMRLLRGTWLDLHQARTTDSGSEQEPIEWVVDRGAGPELPPIEVQLAYNAVRDLPPPQREAIAAVDVLGLSHRDAARALGIRRAMLRRRLISARERIAAALDET